MGQVSAFNLQNYINEFGIQIYFETGTGEGISLDYAKQFPFKTLYSVDIDGELVETAREKFKNSENIIIIHDYSANAIKEFVPKLSKDSPTLFFLDAHFPGADFHKITYEQSIREFKKDAFPLEEELNEIINNRDVSKDVFIIDDFILYEPDGNYETIKQGVIWKYKWLQEELNLETNSTFIYKLFSNTHDFVKDERHQGYLIIKPKK